MRRCRLPMRLIPAILAAAFIGCPTQAHATVITGFSSDFTADQGVPFTIQQVAIFEDDNPAAAPGDFLAIIDWGDGSPTSSGFIGISDTEFPVLGNHTYVSFGDFTVTVTIDDQSPGTGEAVVTSNAHVNAQVVPEPSTAILLVAGFVGAGWWTTGLRRRATRSQDRETTPSPAASPARRARRPIRECG